MSLKWPDKDPDEVLDYDIDWSARLDTGDTISASLFSVAAGDVVVDSDSHQNTETKVWLSGGTNSTVAAILNPITTAAGRQFDQTVRLRIRTR